jgi:hypothetical protein
MVLSGQQLPPAVFVGENWMKTAVRKMTPFPTPTVNGKLRWKQGLALMLSEINRASREICLADSK